MFNIFLENSVLQGLDNVISVLIFEYYHSKLIHFMIDLALALFLWLFIPVEWVALKWEHEGVRLHCDPVFASFGFRW